MQQGRRSEPREGKQSLIRQELLTPRKIKRLVVIKEVATEVAREESEIQGGVNAEPCGQLIQVQAVVLWCQDRGWHLEQ